MATMLTGLPSVLALHGLWTCGRIPQEGPARPPAGAGEARS
jgi:hypothetical protein